MKNTFKGISCTAIIFMILYIIQIRYEFLSESQVENYIPQDIITFSSKTVYQYWKNASFIFNYDEVKKKCLNFIQFNKDVDENYLNCNPFFMSCLIQENLKPYNGKIIKNKNGKKYKITLKNKTSDWTYASEESFDINLFSKTFLVDVFINDVTEKKYTIALLDSCHEKFMPEKSFNYSKNIFIDTNLVTEGDFTSWEKRNNTDKYSLKNQKSDKKYYPKLNVEMELAEAYCSFFRKKVLSKEVFNKVIFYLSKSNQLSFIKKYFRDHKKNKLTERCKAIYTLDCFENINYKYYSHQNPSWNGINELFGGFPELIKDEKENSYLYKKTSLYFNFNDLLSFSEKLLWEYYEFEKYIESFDQSKFDNLFRNSFINKYTLFSYGFRCFREVT